MFLPFQNKELKKLEKPYLREFWHRPRTLDPNIYSHFGHTGSFRKWRKNALVFLNIISAAYVPLNSWAVCPEGKVIWEMTTQINLGFHKKSGSQKPRGGSLCPASIDFKLFQTGGRLWNFLFLLTTEGRGVFTLEQGGHLYFSTDGEGTLQVWVGVSVDGELLQIFQCQ